MALEGAGHETSQKIIATILFMYYNFHLQLAPYFRHWSFTHSLPLTDLTCSIRSLMMATSNDSLVSLCFVWWILYNSSLGWAYNIIFCMWHCILCQFWVGIVYDYNLTEPDSSEPEIGWVWLHKPTPSVLLMYRGSTTTWFTCTLLCINK